MQYIVTSCWGALWIFMFIAMALYAALIPDSVGWGTVRLEASFGLLRFRCQTLSRWFLGP